MAPSMMPDTYSATIADAAMLVIRAILSPLPAATICGRFITSGYGARTTPAPPPACEHRATRERQACGTRDRRVSPVAGQWHP
ncbi:hypothetical protein GCM10011505_13030 [Tistrella bauzanensis]|uniref:Uncharacterized protein n=1 Tax=Tistrella bauzanensis TaxID=657419 RepID=A0ABQ1IDA8_9PROT|nr:hypothetical protein GCM10011505_13030 [Tistrella bauzanensis]